MMDFADLRSSRECAEDAKELFDLCADVIDQAEAEISQMENTNKELRSRVTQLERTVTDRTMQFQRILVAINEGPESIRRLLEVEFAEFQHPKPLVES